MHLSLKRAAALLTVLALCACTGMALAHNDIVKNPDYQTPVKPIAEDLRLNYLSEGFEDAVPPAGWLSYTSGNSTPWELTTQASHSGAACAAVFYGNQGAFQDEWLVTPAMDLSAATAPSLEFYEMGSYWSGYGLRHEILASTTGTAQADFNSVVIWTPGTHDIPAAFGDEPVLVDLSAFAGEPVVYLAIRYEGDWADDWLIDDLRVFEPSDHDVAAVEALPMGHADGGVAFVPQGVVKNVGLNTESFDLLYEIHDGATLVYSETAYVAGLAMGDEATVDFPSYTPDEGLFYTTTLTTQLAGDEDASNDSVGGGFDTYPLGHVPLAFLFTNSGCGPCVQANQGWDAYMADNGDDNLIALMRIHAWWPFGGDIMFLANEEQCTAYINEFGVNGVPDMWLDGLAGWGTDTAGIIAAAEAARYDASPMTVTPVFWNMATEQLTVEVEVIGTLPDTDYVLVSCITEDNISHAGGNGEDTHHQAFRYAYPDYTGMPVDLQPGLNTFTVDMPLDAGWVFPELRATVYVQDRGSYAFRDIVETGTNFLENIADVTPVVLSHFDVASTPGSVDIAWEAALDGEFRLERVADGIATELDFTSLGSGRYEASDAIAASGEHQYQLFGRAAGEDWMLLRSENVQVSGAIFASRIAGNHPNPFNPKTTIKFAVAETGLVKLDVFDLQGRHVANLFTGVKEAGEHSVSWDAGDLGSGVYLVKMSGQGFSDSRKVVLTK